MGIRYAFLRAEDITAELFTHFQRRQTVTRCWRKRDGKWTIQDIAFVDDWTEAEYEKLVTDLIDTCNQGGAVMAAFRGDQLKGFAAVLPTLFGRNGEYLDLPSLHVSEDMRGRGIGSALFGMARQWAKEHGAKKLYISAHSAVESQAFYRAMGCVEAEEYNREHVRLEPCDCQLECKL